MKLPKLLAGRITRRMVALFVIFALVPVTVALLIAYGGVHDLLVAQRSGFLRYEAAAYGTSLVERLNMAEALARSIGSDLAAGRDRLRGLEGYFRSAAILGRDGRRGLFGDPSGLPKDEILRLLEPRVASGRPVVVVGEASQSRPGVWFLLRVPTAKNELRLALEVNPDFLWTHDELPYLTDVCVLSAEREPLNCSGTLSPAARAAMAALLHCAPLAEPRSA